MTVTCGSCGEIYTTEAPAFCGSCGKSLGVAPVKMGDTPMPPPPVEKPVALLKPPPIAATTVDPPIQAPAAGAPRSAPPRTIPEAPLASALAPIALGGPSAKPPEPVAPPGKAKHLAAGTLIDKKYAVLRVLGEGGMGVVYLARDIHTGLDVVVKAVRTELVHRNDVRARTLAEGRALAQIDHPNVVHLRAVAVEESNLFLVMQYIEGDSLDKIIGGYRSRGARMPIDEALGIFRQIASGVGAAHEEGVIHRDLKPANVIVRRKDKVAKVTDFGIALVPSDTTRPKTRGILGSLWYMSPEQVIGRRDLDHRVDIYALGIMLYQMLAGRVPYDAKTDYDIMKLHAEAPLPRVRDVRPDVPAAVDDIIVKACAKDRDQRFQRCEELVLAVDRALSAPAPLAQAAPGLTPPIELRNPVAVPPPTPPIPLVKHAPSSEDPSPADAADEAADPSASGEADASAVGEGESAPEGEGDADSADDAGLEPAAGGVASEEATADDESVARAEPPPRHRRVARRIALAVLLLAGLGAGAVIAFGLVPGVRGVPALVKLLGRGGRHTPPDAGAPTASASAAPPDAGPAKSLLEMLAGPWVGHGRELEAVLHGDELEFRVKRPEQFPQQGYEAGEARFVLRATSEPNVFTVEDRLRPVPPLGKTYDPRARASCQEVWTAVGGDPLRARFDATHLSVEFAKIEPSSANFTLDAPNGSKVIGCTGLRDVRASKVKNTLARL